MKGAAKKLVVENHSSPTLSAPVPFKYGSGSNSFNYSMQGRRYVPFLGPMDNLATQLLEARLTSTTQNACVNTIVESVIGNGLYIVDVEKPEPELITFLTNTNNASHTCDEILRACSDGFFTGGNHFIELVRGSLAGKKFMKVYDHSLLFCRVGETDPDTGVAKTILINKAFTKNGYVAKTGSKAEKELSIYPNWTMDNDSIERTIIHFKNEVNGIDWYGLPPSIAGLNYQIAESKSIRYNIDNFDNNMVLGGMLILKGAMSAEEAQASAQEILLSHVGDGKTGRIAVVSSEQGLDGVEFKPYETTKDGSFIEFDKRIEEKIIAANCWDKRLAGLDRDGGLSNGDGNLAAIYDIKNALLLNPFRVKLISKVLKPIIEAWAEWLLKPEVLKYAFDFNIKLPLSFYGNIDPATFITIDEARGMAKMQPDADEAQGKKYLSQNKSESKANAQPKPVK